LIARAIARPPVMLATLAIGTSRDVFFRESLAARPLLLLSFVSSEPIEVEIVLDEDDLFEAPYQSGYRMRVGGAALRGNSTAAFSPSTAVLDAMIHDDDDEVTRVSLDEVRKRLAGRR
jgi:hypothetical protein